MSHPGTTSTPSTDPPHGPRHDPFEAIRVSNYRLFATGFCFSSTGLQMLGAALGWEIYHRTGDALSLGLVGLCRALPVVIMALPAGYVIDSFDRRRVLLFTQIGFAFAAALLALLSHQHAPIWLIYVLITLMGCVRSFNGPVRSSLLPDLVPTPTFANAVTWNSFIFQVSAIGGPLLGGWIIHRTGSAWWVYLGASVGCAIFAITSLWLVPLHGPGSISDARAAAAQPATPVPPVPPVPPAPPRRLSFSGMLAGMSHVWREKTILAALTLDLFAVLLGGATALLPIYAEEILHVGPVGYGWLKAAPYLGAAVMGLVLAYFPLRRHTGMKVLLAVAGFGVCTIVFGLSTSFWLSMLMLITLGALDSISVVVRHVLVQLRTPRELRGRVSAVNSVFIECSNELGGFESGAVAKLAGSVWGTVAGTVFSVVSGGIGTILVVIGVAVCLPDMRRLDRLDSHPADPPK